jgi:formamidopyrimidine-DNA glycosylase
VAICRIPELPDLLHVQSVLRQALLGRRVTGERVRQPVLMRFAVRGNLSLLLGRSVDDILRRNHFLVFRFQDLDLAVNPMLAGRFRLATAADKEEASLGFVLDFDDMQLRYVDDKLMGKAYLLAAGDWKAVPGMEGTGVDVLSPQFTAERFVSLLKHRRDQVRAFLMDKKALDSLGNAYADEVLFEAGIHPKTFCYRLGHEDALRLHAAVVTVMSGAAAEVSRRNEPIEVKVRDFLKIRLRTECPRCGSKVRRAGVKGMDAYFCPRCQPATRAGFVEWTRTGK